VVARVVTAPAVAPPGSDDRCPGAVHAIAADDGALARVRVPGGYLDTAAMDALAAIAERFGDGELDITARANVQLRGLCERDLDAIATALAAAGLLPSVAHERVRNIVANPFAGFDPNERIDVRPLVAALDRALVADAALSALPPKFLFAFDGGGRGADTRGADIAAYAFEADAAPRFAISLAGEASTFEVDADEVVTVMLALARRALALAEETGCAPGTWRLRTLPRGLERIPAQPVAYARSTAVERRALSSRETDAPLGVFASADPDRLSLVPSISLGRVSAAQAHALAQLASDHGADLRLGCWRGVAIGGFPRAALTRAQGMLLAAGMPLDARDGFAGVAACAGRGACDAALADVRADAAAYAALVASSAETRWNVNFAGCEKRCAMRRGAEADLVATASGYDVWLSGERVAASLDAGTAIAIAARARERGAT
jgi:precorrin-3B synthase